MRDRLVGACSEIWSAPAAPVQAAAAVAFSEPSTVTERIARSRRLHRAVARAVAALLTRARGGPRGGLGGGGRVAVLAAAAGAGAADAPPRRRVLPVPGLRRAPRGAV